MALAGGWSQALAGGWSQVLAGGRFVALGGWWVVRAAVDAICIDVLLGCLGRPYLRLDDAGSIVDCPTLRLNE